MKRISNENRCELLHVCYNTRIKKELCFCNFVACEKLSKKLLSKTIKNIYFINIKYISRKTNNFDAILFSNNLLFLFFIILARFCP